MASKSIAEKRESPRPPSNSPLPPQGLSWQSVAVKPLLKCGFDVIVASSFHLYCNCELLSLSSHSIRDHWLFRRLFERIFPEELFPNPSPPLSLFLPFLSMQFSSDSSRACSVLSTSPYSQLTLAFYLYVYSAMCFCKCKAPWSPKILSFSPIRSLTSVMSQKPNFLLIVLVVDYPFSEQLIIYKNKYNPAFFF